MEAPQSHVILLQPSILTKGFLHFQQLRIMASVILFSMYVLLRTSASFSTSSQRSGI